jgi:hypothetical protein
LPTHKPLAGITPAEAQKLYESLGERFATATHHAALKRAKELYRWAIEHNHVTTKTLCAGEAGWQGTARQAAAVARRSAQAQPDAAGRCRESG